MTTIILILVIAALALLTLTRLLLRVEVQEHETVLFFRRGLFVRILEPGHHYLSRYGTRLQWFDLRQQILVVNGQEVATKDQVPIKANVQVTWAVADARKAHDVAVSYDEALYRAIQVALRSVVARYELEELVPNHSVADSSLIELVTPAAERLGLRVDSLALVDVMVRNDLKIALGEVVKARVEARAKIERARGEQAMLRKLANTARILRETEGLYDLRLFNVAERAAENSSNTLVLGLDKDQSRLNPS